jgi:diguanylate cyclase
MPRHWPQPDLDLPSGERIGEVVERAKKALVGRNGQTLRDTADVMSPRQGITIPARPEELRRLLGASIDENRHLLAQVWRLEAEVDRSSAELAKLRAALRGAVQDALTDPLTGLANRRSFDLELGVVGARASQSLPAQLVMADIDHFKRVNDRHGHDIGDEVLRIVGEVLRANVRRGSLIARVGGDEFGVLLPRASTHYTAGIVIRLCELLASRPLVVRGHPEVTERITLSIGVAAWHAGESSARWYARADAALYEAKRRGRNGVAVDTRQQTAPEAPHLLWKVFSGGAWLGRRGAGR